MAVRNYDKRDDWGTPYYSDPEDIKALQTALKGMGYYSGAVTGVQDKPTVDAYGKWRMTESQKNVAAQQAKMNDPNGWFVMNSRTLASSPAYDRDMDEMISQIRSGNIGNTITGSTKGIQGIQLSNNEGNLGIGTGSGNGSGVPAIGGGSPSTPSGYNSQWDAAIRAKLDEILGRGSFQYNFANDPDYQMMRDKTIQQGRMAMIDTMGSAAGLTGGYGSTYSQTAGQQAYNAYLQSINDVIPTLRQAAVDRWQLEGNRLNNEFGLLKGQDDTQYGRYRDTVLDAQQAAALQAQQAQWNAEFSYRQQQDALDQANWEKEFALKSAKSTGGGGSGKKTSSSGLLEGVLSGETPTTTPTGSTQISGDKLFSSSIMNESEFNKRKSSRTPSGARVNEASRYTDYKYYVSSKVDEWYDKDKITPDEYAKLIIKYGL